MRRRRGPSPVGGDVLEAVGDPDVHEAGGSELAAEVFADAAAGLAVVDPEAAHRPVGAGEGQVVDDHIVGEEGGVEVEAQPALTGELHPAREVLGQKLALGDVLSAGQRVARVQVDAGGCRG